MAVANVIAQRDFGGTSSVPPIVDLARAVVDSAHTYLDQSVFAAHQRLQDDVCVEKTA